MKYFIAFIVLLLVKVSPVEKREPASLSISKSELKNKIKGGWAGQAIGVAFANSSALAPNPLSALQKGFIEHTFKNNSSAFDDVYLELAFLHGIEKNGLDASPLVLANGCAESGYTFSHANQIGQYNILHGIKPPLSGHWTNNPHADDVDFQMQADFIGLMSPGLPATASRYSEKIGHIMSSGDGYYAGLYVATMYSLAFDKKNIEQIIEESISTIPIRTRFYDCVTQAIDLHAQFPNDWRRAKVELLNDWSKHIKCPTSSLEKNVDAKLSAAYLTLALLYGKMDFDRTMEIAASLCRTNDTHIASAAGILGTRLGYSKIPDAWKEGVETIETSDIKFTTTSMREAWDLTYKHALRNIERNGGKLKSDAANIVLQKPIVTQVERSFESHYVSEIRTLENQTLSNEFEFDFEGIGFLVKGDVISAEDDSDFSFNLEIFVDNRLVDTIDLPVNASKKRSELCWKYQMPHGKHLVKIRLLNPTDQHQLLLTDIVVYDVNEVTLSRLPR